MCVARSLVNQSVTSAAIVPERSGLDQQRPVTLFCHPFFLLPASSASNLWANRESQICSPDQSHRIPCIWLAASNFPSPYPIYVIGGYHRWWWHVSISEVSCPSSLLPPESEFLFQMWFLWFKCDSCFSRTGHLPYLLLNSQYLSPSTASHFTKLKRTEQLDRCTWRKETRWELNFVNILMINSSDSRVSLCKMRLLKVFL